MSTQIEQSFYDFDEDTRGDEVFTYRRQSFDQFAGEPCRRLDGWGDFRHSPARSFLVYLSDDGDQHWLPRLHWLDHLYRIKFASGRVVFCTEPYHLNDDDLVDLIAIREDGWKVSFGGYRCHHPSTVAIHIKRPDAEGATA